MFFFSVIGAIQMLYDDDDDDDDDNVAPPGELRVKAGVVCWQVKLCDPHLSALEVRFSRRRAIQIDHLYLFADVVFNVFWI